MAEVIRVPVLNDGYVELVNFMGTDLSVVNAARTSYQKRTADMRPQDRRLIQFLAQRHETSPFRHAFLSFEVRAPLMVARQHWKYIVGSDHTMEAWNEASRRYVTDEAVFYIPEEWRSAPEHSKQGSGGALDEDRQQKWKSRYLRRTTEAFIAYEDAIADGVAPELARLFLPAYALFVTYRWSASLNAVLHFVAERLEDKAQWEIQQYAKVIARMTEILFPVSYQEYITASAPIVESLIPSSTGSETSTETE